MGTYVAVLFTVCVTAWLLWRAGTDVAQYADPTWAPYGHTPNDVCTCTTCAMPWQIAPTYTHTFTQYPHTDTLPCALCVEAYGNAYTSAPTYTLYPHTDKVMQ